MNTPHALRLIIAGTLLSGGVAVAGIGPAAGTAQASCNAPGNCSIVWCPGHSLPAPDVKWDMSRCHTYYSGHLGEPGTAGGIQVGAHIIEGEPQPVNPCGAAPICLPGL